MSGDEAMAHLRVQEYLDDVSKLNLSMSKSQWYNIDVAALLVNCKLIGHDIDDKRNFPIDADGIIFKAELFSISPSEEQLCWEEVCRSEMEIPMIQNKISRWLSWLNT